MRRLIFEILEFLRYLNYGIESKNPYQQTYKTDRNRHKFKFAK